MNQEMQNPHLEGDSFLWQAGPWGVVLFHGFTATTAEVRLLGKKLFEAGYSVAAPLLPGHGTTPAELSKVRWRDWVNVGEKSYIDLAARCKGVVIAGESMGALVALAVAARQPGCRGVILFAPAYRLKINWLDRINLTITSPFFPYIPKRRLDEAGKWQGYKVNPTRGILELLRLQDEVKKGLHQIHQPVLIFQGRLDKTIDPQSGALILKDIGSSQKELVWMENSPHVVILGDELEAVTQKSISFVQSVVY